MTVRNFTEDRVCSEKLAAGTVEFIKPSDFTDLLRASKVGLSEEYEQACLLKVLMKAELGGVILLEELTSLL